MPKRNVDGDLVEEEPLHPDIQSVSVSIDYKPAAAYMPVAYRNDPTFHVDTHLPTAVVCEWVKTALCELMRLSRMPIGYATAPGGSKFGRVVQHTVNLQRGPVSNVEGQENKFFMTPQGRAFIDTVFAEMGAQIKKGENVANLDVVVFQGYSNFSELTVVYQTDLFDPNLFEIRTQILQMAVPEQSHQKQIIQNYKECEGHGINYTPMYHVVPEGTVRHCQRCGKVA